jgi:hypothetical protein
MGEALKANAIRKAKAPSLIAVGGGIALFYVVLGCSRDWVVVAGLLLNVLGAYLIVMPDIGPFNRLFYAGRLQNARKSLFRSPTETTISPQANWYDEFRTEFAAEFDSVTDASEFFIDDVANQFYLFHRPDADADANVMSVSNADERLKNAIRSEQVRIRKQGAQLLLPGFLLQLLGTVFDATFGFGLIC